jgi:hypothetical protein
MCTRVRGMVGQCGRRSGRAGAREGKLTELEVSGASDCFSSRWRLVSVEGWLP